MFSYSPTAAPFHNCPAIPSPSATASKSVTMMFPRSPKTPLYTSIEYRYRRDADGLDTHTAADRYVFQANFSGNVGGVAPKACLAVNKVCWKDSGCLDSEILAGFGHTVADGVDVLNISIDGGEGIASPYYLDHIGHAVADGCHQNLAPWITNVGTSTLDRIFTLGNGHKLAGLSLYFGLSFNGQMYLLVYTDKSDGLSASLCMESYLNPKLVKDKIIICDRGSNPWVAKGLVVKEAGGADMYPTARA